MDAPGFSEGDTLRRKGTAGAHGQRAFRMHGRWFPMTAWIVTLFAVYALTQVNFEHDMLRFEVPALNPMFLFTALCIPYVIIVLGFFLPRWWIRVVITLFCLPLILNDGFLMIFLPSTTSQPIQLGYDPGFKLIEYVDEPSYKVEIYQTDCGAPCHYGIAVRQERQILPGVLLVREFPGFYPAHSASIERLGQNRIRLSARDYLNNDRLSSQLYQFRPWVWW